MRDKRLIACALNLNADPHPPGIYVEALRLAAKQGVRARGDNFLEITPPRKIREIDAYEGRILLWTEVDVEGRWLDTEAEEELEDKTNIRIPNNAKPNYRTFNYIFTEKRHRFYFESSNEFGEKLGITTAKSCLSFLLGRDEIAAKAKISVSIEPDKAGIERILKTPGLQTIDLRINRPNGDLPGNAARRRVLAKLEAAGATRLEEHWAARGQGVSLHVTPEITDHALVAAETGFFRAQARNADGPPIRLSSDEVPRRYFISLLTGETFFQRLKAKFKDIT